MLTLLNKSSTSYMQLASTKQRPEEGETSLATEPFQRFLANMVETAHCHFQMLCHAKLRPYTTAHILTFLVAFHNILLPPESITEADHQRNWYVVVWDNTPTASGAAPPTKLCISEPPPEFLVLGLWAVALYVHASCASCGGAMWRNWCGCDSGMDETLKAFLPSVPGKGRRCLWCGQGVVGRPSCAATCCLIILLTCFFFFPYIFYPNFLFLLSVFWQ